MTQPAVRTGPRSAAGPWDLSFLRVGVLVTAGLALVAVPVTGLVAGWSQALGVAVGAVVVAAFFSLSGLVVAWAGKIDDSYTLPAALGTFFVKALVLFAVLDALPEDGVPGRAGVAWAVLVGALVWGAVQLRWVWTRQLYYVTPPQPPRASPDPGVLPRAVEHPDGGRTGG